MFFLRPVSLEDVDPIYDIAAQAKIGLTTLPHDHEVLSGRITESVKTFQDPPKRPSGETFIFVLQDCLSGSVVGTSGIISKVGGFHPNYTYKIQTVVKESKLLNVRKEIKFLKLHTDHNGPTEIGSLFLAPNFRKTKNAGRLLALSRFLFMAEFPHYFEKETIAEMRGAIDESGKSIFWEALGRHFFEVEFKIADLMGMKDKSFIADLMPKHPIYIPLLPQEAQEVIGKLHEKTRPAHRLLQQEGFRFIDEVDIFEAGPVLGCPNSKIRTIRESTVGRLAEITADDKRPANYLIANVNGILRFRVCCGTVRKVSKSELSITPEVAEILRVKIGDRLRFSPIYPQSTKTY